MTRVAAGGIAAAALLFALWPAARSHADTNFCAGPTFGNVSVSGHIWERDFPTNEFVLRVQGSGCEPIDIQVFLPGRAADYPNCEPPHNATVTGRVLLDDDILVIRNPVGVDCY